MHRVLTASLVLLLSAPAWTFQARPLSNLRFDGRDGDLVHTLVGSDGTDFLVLSTNYFSFGDQRVYVQRVVRGVPVGPQLAIGRGSGAGIVWTGTEYLAAWSSAEGLWTARISRQGALIARSSEPVTSHGGWFASNGRSAMAITRVDNQTLAALPLDLHGRPSGTAVTFSMPNHEELSVGPSGGGYAIVSTGWRATSLMLVGTNGVPATASPMILEGPYAGTSTLEYRSAGSRIATDGTDTLVVFAGERLGDDSLLKTVVVSAGGTIKRAAQVAYKIAGAGERSLQPAAIVWDGSQYAMSVAVSKDPTGNFTTVDTGLLRLSRSGEMVGGIAYATTGERRKMPTGLGWNGSELLASWYDTTNQQGYGVYCATVPLATMTPSAPSRLGRTLARQSGVAVGASHGQYLAAWYETADGVTTIRASRLDAAGNYLDRDGIPLGNLTLPAPHLPAPTIAIDGDETSWLVVWANGSVRGRRLSRDGAPLDAQSFAIGSGYEAAVRWNGGSYVVVSSDGSLYSRVVSRGGAVTAARTLAREVNNFDLSSWTTYRSPLLAVTRGHVLTTFRKEEGACFAGTPGGCYTGHTILGLRLDASSVPLDAAPFEIATNVWPQVALATDGTRYLVAWAQSGGIFGAFLPAEAPQQGGNRFRIVSSASSPALAFDGQHFVAAWRIDNPPRTIVTARVSSSGTTTDTTMLRLEDGEAAQGAVVAASDDMPALVGFVDRHSVYDDVWRGALLFSSEFAAAPGVPSPPSIINALMIDRDALDVGWQTTERLLGVLVELQLSDGAYRAIGVASGDAHGARVSVAGLEGSAVRIRGWNASGLSEASRTIPIALPRQRAIRAR